jgi:hypothetical protein
MPSFETDGYSQQSLDMLKTPEGQSNMVFACYGSAAQHAQLFEQALREFLSVYRRARAKSLRGQKPPKQPKDQEKRTMGQLLSEFLDSVSVKHEGIAKTITDALPLRNHLIHRYFLDRDSKLRTEEGRHAMLSELLIIEQVLRQATAVVGGIRVAFNEAIEGKRSESGETLFQVEVHLPDG